MYRIPATLYVFLSGLLISVSTSAATQLVFSVHRPLNSGNLTLTAVMALVAGSLWFVTSELVTSADKQITLLAAGRGTREGVEKAVARKLKIALVVCPVVATALSLAWPFLPDVFPVPPEKPAATALPQGPVLQPGPAPGTPRTNRAQFGTAGLGNGSGSARHDPASAAAQRPAQLPITH
jgi:uncharacterized membrane protein